MPFPTCNPWITNTVRQTDQVAVCKSASAQANAQEIPDVTFLLAIIDSLQRLAVVNATGFEELSALVPCENELNAHKAYVCLNEVSAPVQASVSELKQIILWQLGNPLCALSA